MNDDVWCGCREVVSGRMYVVVCGGMVVLVVMELWSGMVILV